MDKEQSMMLMQCSVNQVTAEMCQPVTGCERDFAQAHPTY